MWDKTLSLMQGWWLEIVDLWLKIFLGMWLNIFWVVWDVFVSREENEVERENKK